MISYLTSKTFPAKLDISADEVYDMINTPLQEMETSALLSNDQSMMDLIVETMPPNLSLELSRDISKIRDTFSQLVEDDTRYAKLVKEAASRVGTVREATKEEEVSEEEKISNDKNALLKQAEEALEEARKKREGN